MIARCVYRRLLSMESLETRRILAPIANGQALLDSFAVGGSREFEFHVDRGDFVRFAVGENDNGADAVLTISAPGGQTVSVNRGSGGVVAQFEAPASGEYQAIVTENGNNSGLAFAARFVALPGTPSLLAGRDAQLTSGQQFASSFGTGGFNLHPFQADAGDLVRVAVGEIDNGADSVLQVFSPGGDRIDIVAESGGSVLQFNAPLSGTYTALVSEDGNNSDLAYAIRFASFPGDSTLIAQRDATLGNGEVSATSFGVGGFNLHPFDADAGDTVRVAVGETDNGADSVLQVISPNGQRLAIESESGGSVIQFDAPVAGTYTALVSENGTEATTGWKPVGSSLIVSYGLKSFAHEGLSYTFAAVPASVVFVGASRQ
ncbi:MAG: pre-peptidase C-terminal domain-containing protein, partial [Planctomycetota bacterium]